MNYSQDNAKDKKNRKEDRDMAMVNQEKATKTDIDRKALIKKASDKIDQKYEKAFRMISKN